MKRKIIRAKNIDDAIIKLDNLYHSNDVFMEELMRGTEIRGLTLDEMQGLLMYLHETYNLSILL